MKLKLSNSYIKGYHIYHVRPHADISMEVERDFDNEYDEFAMKVSMPDVTKVKAGLLDAITRPVYLILKNGTALRDPAFGGFP